MYLTAVLVVPAYSNVHKLESVHLEGVRTLMVKGRVIRELIWAARCVPMTAVDEGGRTLMFKGSVIREII